MCSITGVPIFKLRTLVSIVGGNVIHVILGGINVSPANQHAVLRELEVKCL